MAWQLLPTNYKDAVWDGMKKYRQIDNSDGTISLDDVTEYFHKENSFFGALEANRMNEAMNYIMSMLENGTSLYEEFTVYFATQKALFTDKANADYEEFKKFLNDTETEGFESLTAIADRAKTSEDNAKSSENAAKTSEINAKASETAAKTSETNAKWSESIAVNAEKLSEAAQKGAETARGQSEGFATRSEQSAIRAEAAAIRVPYVGENGNWFVWDATANTYVDSGAASQGATGAKGEQGVQGVPGEQGVNGVAVASDGIFAFNVDANGHLILEYTGTEAPDAFINSEGHLIFNF